MSDLFQLLGGIPAGTYVESGVLVSALKSGKYTVSINGVEHNVESTVPGGELSPGMRVIINRTDAGRFIIGASRQFLSNKSQEVIIDG